MIRLFISRSLTGDSPIRKICSENDIHFVDESLLKFEAIPFNSFASTDWIFFYSKNGVKFFYEQWTEPLPATTKIGVMGLPTGKSIETYSDVAIDFIGKGDPASVTAQFQKVAKNQSVLFIKAKFSRSSIDSNLTGIDSNELIVYDNTVRDDFVLSEVPDILIFTSPMNATAYLEKYSIPEKSTVMAIGPTTSRALEIGNVPIIHIAKFPTEDSLAELFKSML